MDSESYNSNEVSSTLRGRESSVHGKDGDPDEMARTREAVAADLLEAEIESEDTLRHYGSATELADELRRVDGELTVSPDCPSLSEGDKVRDTEPADWLRRANKNRFVVREVTDVPISEYWYQGDTTVAEVNSSYDPDQPTVVIERDGTELAYPIERIEPLE